MTDYREPCQRSICPECGGDCAPECGLHPAGCTFGGFSVGYWLAVPGCDRNHAEPMEPTHADDDDG